MMNMLVWASAIGGGKAPFLGKAVPSAETAGSSQVPLDVYAGFDD
jgi:hypothetical protein